MNHNVRKQGKIMNIFLKIQQKGNKGFIFPMFFIALIAGSVLFSLNFYLAGLLRLGTTHREGNQ